MVGIESSRFGSSPGSLYLNPHNTSLSLREYRCRQKIYGYSCHLHLTALLHDSCELSPLPRKKKKSKSPQRDRGTVCPSSDERSRVSQPADGPPGRSKEKTSQGRRRQVPDAWALTLGTPHEPYSNPCSAKLNTASFPRMMWSSTLMLSRPPAVASLAVTLLSCGDGSTTPDGWLWAKNSAEAPT